MKIEKLKEFISFAKEAVKEEKDEMIKAESFKIILNKMIDGGFTKSTQETTLNKINHKIHECSICVHNFTD